MPRIRIKQDDQKQRKSISEAQKIFIMHCKLKNLAPYTIKYYEENLNFFQPSSPLIKNVDEITQDVIDSYSSMLMGKGDRITAINARLRGLFVFLRFSFKKGWAESYPLSQLKEDEYAKEPYRDEKLKKLLERPTSGNWAEWSSWAVINLLIATGFRASTVVNIKISDVDFEHRKVFGFFASLRLSGELLLTIFFISGIDNYIGSRNNHITIYRMTIYRTAMEVSNMPGTPALTEATYYILLSLYRPRHGYGIMQQTEELSGGHVRLAAGTLYGALNTLCDKGWIVLKTVDEDSRRKEYLLTDKGREILINEVKRLKELARNGEMILGEEL